MPRFSPTKDEFHHNLQRLYVSHGKLHVEDRTVYQNYSWVKKICVRGRYNNKKVLNHLHNSAEKYKDKEVDAKTYSLMDNIDSAIGQVQRYNANVSKKNVFTRLFTGKQSINLQRTLDDLNNLKGKIVQTGLNSLEETYSKLHHGDSKGRASLLWAAYAIQRSIEAIGDLKNIANDDDAAALDDYQAKFNDLSERLDETIQQWDTSRIQRCEDILRDENPSRAYKAIAEQLKIAIEFSKDLDKYGLQLESPAVLSEMLQEADRLRNEAKDLKEQGALERVAEVVNFIRNLADATNFNSDEVFEVWRDLSDLKDTLSKKSEVRREIDAILPKIQAVANCFLIGNECQNIQPAVRNLDEAIMTVARLNQKKDQLQQIDHFREEELFADAVAAVYKVLDEKLNAASAQARAFNVEFERAIAERVSDIDVIARDENFDTASTENILRHLQELKTHLNPRASAHEAIDVAIVKVNAAVECFKIANDWERIDLQAPNLKQALLTVNALNAEKVKITVFADRNLAVYGGARGNLETKLGTAHRQLQIQTEQVEERIRADQDHHLMYVTIEMKNCRTSSQYIDLIQHVQNVYNPNLYDLPEDHELVQRIKANEKIVTGLIVENVRQKIVSLQDQFSDNYQVLTLIHRELVTLTKLSPEMFQEFNAAVVEFEAQIQSLTYVINVRVINNLEATLLPSLNVFLSKPTDLNLKKQIDDFGLAWLTAKSTGNLEIFGSSKELIASIVMEYLDDFHRDFVNTVQIGTLNLQECQRSIAKVHALMKDADFSIEDALEELEKINVIDPFNGEPSPISIIDDWRHEFEKTAARIGLEKAKLMAQLQELQASNQPWKKEIDEILEEDPEANVFDSDDLEIGSISTIGTIVNNINKHSKQAPIRLKTGVNEITAHKAALEVMNAYYLKDYKDNNIYSKKALNLYCHTNAALFYQTLLETGMFEVIA